MTTATIPAAAAPSSVTPTAVTAPKATGTYVPQPASFSFVAAVFATVLFSFVLAVFAVAR